MCARLVDLYTIM